jgi:23S rRNA pseudouridine955/2504/2580 synthase
VIELNVSADASGQRLDKYIRKALRDVPLSHVYKMLRTRKVRLNGARGRGEEILAAGDKVVIRGDEEKLLAQPDERTRPAGKVRITFHVLFQDDHLLIIDKPSGLASHPGTGITGATLVEEARAFLKVPADLAPGEFRASPAHRLDRETSGIVLVARTRQAMVKLTEIFTSGEEVKKTYLGLAKGKLPRSEGLIDLPLSEHEQTTKSKDRRGVNFQEALTRYRVVSSMKEATLLSIRIETGRTHQIRRHLQAAGHPVVGDRRYGDFPFNREAQQRWGLRRMFLHAWKLELPHPITGERLRISAPLPKELEEVLSALNLSGPEPTGPTGGARQPDGAGRDGKGKRPAGGPPLDRHR